MIPYITLVAVLVSSSCSGWRWPSSQIPEPLYQRRLYQPSRSYTPTFDREPRRQIYRDVVDNSIYDRDDLPGHLSHLEGQLFMLPDNRTGDKVAQWHEGMGVNPEELGEYAEGDILYPASMARNGIKTEASRWPGGVIPFVISPFFNDKQKKLIEEAMADYQKHTCIRFKPYTGEESDYIRITAGNTGCWSSVGKVGGVQDVNLQVPGCVTKKGTVIHELMHAVGFLHEQSRSDRDEYINVQWPNIMPGREGNFEKSSTKTTEAFGVGYDYGSVMHYSANAFSRNGRATIVPKGGTSEKLGQRESFSIKDIQKIRRMYKCSKRRRNTFFFF